jgi:hypothetical protein
LFVDPLSAEYFSVVDSSTMQESVRIISFFNWDGHYIYGFVQPPNTHLTDSAFDC